MAGVSTLTVGFDAWQITKSSLGAPGFCGRVSSSTIVAFFWAILWTEARYQGFLNSAKGDKAVAEATMNHLHVLHLFGTVLPTKELVLYVGRLMKEIWQVKLNRDFPGRRVTVFFPEEDDLELIEYEITFSQQR